MGVAAAFFLVEDNGAGLALQAQLALCHLDSGFKCCDGYIFPWGRVQAQREQRLFSPCSPAGGLDFLKRSL